MTDVLRWAELSRARITELLPEAVVAMAIGATEQHGPHLGTGTDAVLASAMLDRAAERYADSAAARPLILAPTLPFGASDHHLPFGGTLSLRAETLVDVLVDLGRSVAADGGRRLVIVNGHGGNSGICHAAAGAIAARTELLVAHVDYWALLSDPSPLPAEAVPGHAGVFETSLAQAVRPELVGESPAREVAPDGASGPALTVHGGSVWRDRDGFTDSPADADAEIGRVLLDRLAGALSAQLVAFAQES